MGIRIHTLLFTLLIFHGMPVVRVVPQQMLSAESPLPRPSTTQMQHTHTHRRMYHEGPPAVAVTDMGNAQNTIINI